MCLGQICALETSLPPTLESFQLHLIMFLVSSWYKMVFILKTEIPPQTCLYVGNSYEMVLALGSAKNSEELLWG